MPPEAQAHFNIRIEEIRASGRHPQLLDFAIARREALASLTVDTRDPYGLIALAASLRDPAPVDPELDALLDTLDEAVPVDEPATVRGRPLDWLDAGLDEEPAPAAANDNPAPASVSKIPKKRGARPRRSFAADRRKLSILRDFVSDARTLKTAPAGTPSVADTTPPHTPSQATRKRRAAAANDNRKAPAWERTTEIAKGHAFARAVSATGAGIAWSLNFGGKVAQAANDNPEGLKERMHDRLTKALKASPLGAREFVFAPECTKAGRWHLHGILDATPAELDALTAVLRQVGGAWDAERCAERQVDARPVWCPDGWIRYMLKGASLTRRLLGCKSVLSATRSCKRRAKDLWDTARSQSALI